MSSRATGGDTIQDIGGYRIHTFTTVGTSTFNPNLYVGGLTVEVLVVAGGGSGGVRHAGGGGAGGYIYNSSFLVSGAVAVTVGDGGAARLGSAGAGSGNSGNNSVFSSLTAIGGGFGSQSAISGSGGSSGGVFSNFARGTASQGFQGGAGSSGGEEFQYQGGGGGGAGAVGQTGGGGSNYKAGNGGAGLPFSVSGTSTYYAGGGGGSTVTNHVSALGGTGGTGGGGAGGGYGSPSGIAGTNGTGGGGGAGGFDGGTNYPSGKGGSGIVIVRYLITDYNNLLNFPIILSTNGFASATGGDTIQDIGGYRIHTFTTVGTSTFKPNSGSLSVEVLVVAGGGSGGVRAAGGGGAGGYVYNSSFSVSGPVTVTVGDGGAANSGTEGSGNSGSNSVFSSLTAIGGGYGSVDVVSGSGGSSGGVRSAATRGAASQGFQGGIGNSGGEEFQYQGGGGGGAGSVGLTGGGGNNYRAGNGGAGLAFSISGTSTYYAGGGGGSTTSSQTSAIGGIGGVGGGGAGGGSGGSGFNGTAGTPNTGGGGGAGGFNGGTNYSSGKGGSGIVIVRYQLVTVNINKSIMQVTTGGSIQMYSRPILTPVLTNPGTVAVSIGSTVTIYQTALQPLYGITWSFSPTGAGLAVSSSSDYKLTLVASSSVAQQLFTVTATNKNNVTTTTQFTCVTPVFNLLSSAAAASAVGVYSLRSLIYAYAMVVNIRNGTTSATQDFYADTLGNLTTLTGGSGQTLVNWLGGATGFVATLYDQSVNGYNLAQPTAANQPPINLTTTPYSMIFDGSDLWIYSASVAFNMGAGSFTLRYVVSNNTGGCVFFKTNDTTFTWPGFAKKFWLGNGATTESARGNFPAQVGCSENFSVSSTAITATVKNSVVHKANATNSVPIYVNGVQASLSTNNIGMSTDPGNYVIIGRGAQASNYIGNTFEIELFSTRLSDADRLALEN